MTTGRRRHGAAPGGDAAVVRVHGTDAKALAISTDCTPRYCYADPSKAASRRWPMTWRNISAVGATPLADHQLPELRQPAAPEIMGQIVGCLEGMGDACRALDFPIVSGNVSLYNESKATGGGSAILPTPRSAASA
ncbi:MAG: AIR synthase related protein [Sphingobium sp.]|jgi:phosphoribosylformylglycinamidine synthase|nr:AIR synthase related protein [Sphingobium sp.]